MLENTECEVNQQEGGEEFKCWQEMVAMLHSNGQLRSERDVKKPALQQKTDDDKHPGQNCTVSVHQCYGCKHVRLCLTVN